MNGVPIPTQVSARAAEIGRLARRGYGSASDWLIERVFPHIVNYAKNPFVILATLGLLVPLILWATNTTFVLFSNSYLNVCSASVSSIVLLQQATHHREVKRLHAAHGEQIAALHAKIDVLQSTTPTPVPPTA